MPESELQSGDPVSLLRHVLATIAFRSSRVLKDAPDGFSEITVGEGGWTAREILAHMTAVLGYMLATVTQTKRAREPLDEWETEVARFYEMLEKLDSALQSEPPRETKEWLTFVQGPLADTLTHIGQLAMMRRLAGSAVPPENYIKADVQIGRLGIDQGTPKAAG